MKRVIQIITGVHRIHHLQYSYGWKLPFLKIGYFDNYGWKNFSGLKFKDKRGNHLKGYHDCTISGIY